MKKVWEKKKGVTIHILIKTPAQCKHIWGWVGRKLLSTDAKMKRK